MRALIRSISGSPASIKGKAKQAGKGSSESYSVGDIASSWTCIKNVLAESAASSSAATDHASTSTIKNEKDTSSQALATLSRSLDIIVDGLVNEQSGLSSDDAGPCLEYVLTNNVFSNIAQAAVLDQPVGLLGLVIRVFDNLVILLGEAFVTFGHRSLNDLLHGCIIHESSQIKHAPANQEPSNAQLKIRPVAEPYEEELASLACSLCSRIKTQPDLLPLFFHDKRLSYRSKGLSGTASSEGAETTTIRVIQHDDLPTSAATSPTSSSAYLSPRPSLSQSSSQASISSTTSASEASFTSPPASSAGTTVESRQYTFLIFDFLIRLLHRHGRIGELARTGLLFIIDLAMSNAKVKIAPPTTSSAPPPFPILFSSKSRSSSSINTVKNANGNGMKRTTSTRRPKRKAVIGQSDRISLLSYIEDSDFADVLSAGLGAAFAVLPSHLYVPIPGMSTTHPEEAFSPLSPTLDSSLEGPSHVMREHGIAISTDSEVKESLELFVSVIDFATDVTRKAPKTKQHNEAITSSASQQNASQASSSMLSVSEKMQSLITAIRSSFGTVFLHNALLPRITDAASPTAEDAAIIAVLTYIDTLVNALEPESPLFEEAISALLTGEDDSGTTTPSKSASAMRDNLRRILSYSLSTHHGSSTAMLDREGPLAASLASSLQLSALRLLHTLLKKADWAALQLFSIQPCVGCTFFPFQVSNEEDEDAEFVYPDEDESDQDSFIYPSEEDHRKTIAAFTANAAQTRTRKTSSQGPNLELFLQLVSNTASAATLSMGSSTGVGERKNLSRHSSKSSFEAPRPGGGSSTHNSMSFSKYIRQAELSIQKDQSFIRGVAVIAAAQAEEVSTTTDRKVLPLKSPAIHIADMSMDSVTSSLQSDATTTSNGHLGPIEDRMIQHKLALHLGIMAQLDALLATFFVNEPAVNLALTKAIAKLAVCPYRSLEGWLIAEEAGGALQSLQSLLIVDKLGLVDSAQDSLPLQHSLLHERSDNSKVTDWLRQSSYVHRTHQENQNIISALSDDPSILAKYANLLNEVEETHREQIKDFDRLLHERRQNMLFVDDLADAMQGDGSASGSSPREATSSGWHSPFTHMARMPGGLVSSPRRTRQRVDSSATEREYVNTLSPYAAHVRETSSKHITVRLPITAEEATNINPMDGAPLSRFWSATSSHSDHAQEGAEAHETDDTPRKSTFGLSPMTADRLGVNTNLMLLSDLKSPMTPDGEGSERKYKEVEVNLSKYLDNLVILEESLKELVAIVIVRMRIGIDPI